MTKSKKALKIFIPIIVLLIIGIIAGICFYLYASEIRFDYCDAEEYIDSADLDDLKASGCQMIYPFFGNSVSLTSGRHYSYPLGIGQGNESVYSAANSVIHSWAEKTVTQYQNKVKISYSVNNDGKILTVLMSGDAYPDDITGQSILIEKEFIFNIENAGKDNLPQLMQES